MPLIQSSEIRSLRDAYKYYVSVTENPVDEKTYRKIVDACIKKYMYGLYENAEELTFFSGLGYFRIKKLKTHVSISRIKRRKMKVNWGETNKLFAKGIRKRVFHINDHSEGYYFKSTWDKSTAKFKNKSAYRFELSRTNKRNLAKLANTGTFNSFA